MKNILKQLKTRSDPTFLQTQTPYSSLYEVGGCSKEDRINKKQILNEYTFSVPPHVSE